MGKTYVRKEQRDKKTGARFNQYTCNKCGYESRDKLDFKHHVCKGE